jgi:hypothetical protein
LKSILKDYGIFNATAIVFVLNVVLIVLFTIGIVLVVASLLVVTVTVTVTVTVIVSGLCFPPFMW